MFDSFFWVVFVVSGFTGNCGRGCFLFSFSFFRVSGIKLLDIFVFWGSRCRSRVVRVVGVRFFGDGVGGGYRYLFLFSLFLFIACFCLKLCSCREFLRVVFVNIFVVIVFYLIEFRICFFILRRKDKWGGNFGI